MKAEIYQTVVDALLPVLIRCAHHHASQENRSYGFKPTSCRPEGQEFDAVLRVRSLTRNARTGRLDRNALGTVQNSVTLLCRNGVEYMRYDSDTETLGIRLNPSVAQFSRYHRKLPDKKIYIAEREYTAEFFGLRDFTLNKEEAA